MKRSIKISDKTRLKLGSKKFLSLELKLGHIFKAQAWARLGHKVLKNLGWSSISLSSVKLGFKYITKIWPILRASGLFETFSKCLFRSWFWSHYQASYWAYWWPSSLLNACTFDFLISKTQMTTFLFLNSKCFTPKIISFLAIKN